MRKFREKNGIYAKKNPKISRKIPNFFKLKQSFSKKRLNFENTNSFSKRDLSASPIDGLTQNINIDLRMTRSYQIFRDIFAFFENVFASFIFAKYIYLSIGTRGPMLGYI